MKTVGCFLVSVLIFTISWSQPPSPVEGGFALVVLPDSQLYVEKRPELYTLQTGWIAANAQRYNIKRVLHVGDITQHDTRIEWEAAVRAHKVFLDLVPGIFAQGNHDMALTDGFRSRESRFSRYITLNDYRRSPGFGGVYDREPHNTQNSFHVFEAGGRQWLVLALEFAPRDDVLRWANQVVANHPRHAVIIMTHAYMKPDGTRYDRMLPDKSKSTGHLGFNKKLSARLEGGYNDGGDVWRKLASQHANIVMVLCGHVATSAHLASRGKHGNTVHQVLVDYQNRPNGGDGWFRLMQFLPDGHTVQVRDYSPLLNETSSDPSCSFSFEIDAL